MMKIAIAGAGYVGLSLGIMLAHQHQVTLVDVLPTKINQIKQKICPLQDDLMQKTLATAQLDLTATLDSDTAYRDAALVIIATPTNYDAKLNQFDTHYVEQALTQVLAVNDTATIVIKSTVPVGYTAQLQQRFPAAHLLFSPEFLRETHALADNLHPSRIIVGSTTPDDPRAQTFANLLKDCATQSDVPVFLMSSTEAEAVKLFANTYLAMRVAYFNELDTYAAANHLNARSMIDGVCSDPRIGAHYNNPSFGYGGYCLPKDTKQLRANFQKLPEKLISATVQANATRKDFIADTLWQRVKDQPAAVIGIYRLTMKTNSDNFRQSAMLGIIERLQAHHAPLIIYEPTLTTTTFNGIPVERDLTAFKQAATVIVANRWSPDLTDVRDRVYTRDIYQRD